MNFGHILSRIRSTVYLFLAITTAVLTAEAQADDEKIRLDFYHTGYVIHKESDGGGADLYLGWITATEKGLEGGTSKTDGGLTNANGEPVNGTGNKKIHRWRRLLFSVEIPQTKTAIVQLNLIEEDRTGDQIREQFSNKKLPVFSSGAKAPDVNFSTTGPKAVADAGASIVSVLRAENTDDDYGFWRLEFKNTGDFLETQMLEFGTSSPKPSMEGKVVMPKCPIDGKGHVLFHSTYEDPENSISPGFEVVVTRLK